MNRYPFPHLLFTSPFSASVCQSEENSPFSARYRLSSLYRRLSDGIFVLLFDKEKERGILMGLVVNFRP